MNSSNNITKLLENTLNPSLIRQAQQSLITSRSNQGFITQLLIIGDDKNYNVTIRQSALIYVKNALLDCFKNNLNLPKSDYDVVKSSILQALIRNCSEKSVTPTIRQIIFILAQKQFPSNWEIISEIANNIQNSGDFNELYGSVEALKAIVSAFGKSINQKITLSNLSNKTVLPLLNLSSKLFQNYNETTSVILISVFKILSTITYFYVPEIILMNMHSWMIFIKKILDLNIEPNNIDKNMYQLKKICMRILFRFYQRHMNHKYSDFQPNVLTNFHEKYTKGIVESLLLQIMNEAHLSKNPKHKRFFQLTKFALSCLSYVYEEDKNAAFTIDKYREKIIYLCLQRYRVRLNKHYESFNDFCLQLGQKRSHLCQFIRAVIRNQYRTAQQNRGNAQQSLSNKVLGNLFNHIEKGDMEIKQLCLYVFSNIASLLPEVDENIESKMLPFILNYVKPLLKNEQTSTLIKLRCCEIIAKYSYVQLPQNELSQIAQGVYGCLINQQNSDLGTYLKIHAAQAFNSLLRYDFIINFISSFLNDILQVYTSLLDVQITIIKCLEDMIEKFQNHLQPYGQNLIQMLSQMYFKYLELINQNNISYLKPNSYMSFKSTNKHKSNEDDQDEFQDDDSSQDDQNKEGIQNNFHIASKACLGAIRQIIQAPSFLLQDDSRIHEILISIFTDKEEKFTEEGFNILNLVLFKEKNIKQEYNLYFILIVNGILPIDKQLVENLKKQNSNYAKTLLKMLECICQNPDSDFIQNTIGCLRNFIAKSGMNLRNQFLSSSPKSFLTSIFEITKYVHENIYEQETNVSATQSERSMILTLYISLIQWKALSDNEVQKILSDINMWMCMEKQIYGTKLKGEKPVYSPIYLQIMLIACHYYPDVSFKQINPNWLITELLTHWDRFNCDYQIARILVSVGDFLNYDLINDQKVLSTLINLLPEMIQKACTIRINEEENDVASMNDEAEEDQLFGIDENTHIMSWKKPIQQTNNFQQQQNIPNQGEMDDEEQAQEQDLDEEFNKYYESPYDNIDEIQFILNILKENHCSKYISLMSGQSQSKLSQIVGNVPPKFDKNN